VSDVIMAVVTIADDVHLPVCIEPVCIEPVCIEPVCTLLVRTLVVGALLRGRWAREFPHTTGDERVCRPTVQSASRGRTVLASGSGHVQFSSDCSSDGERWRKS
jgi:hypothetical protein